ncbi:hypothetical protein [Microbacterium laevaniformans]|uniref:hypothetical protein n=1 Tax=Microbacterium laevaniformans TaxID=36807 RepID=UPI003672817A
MASIELIRLCDTWGDVATKLGVSGDLAVSGGLFWSALEHRVRHAIFTYKEQDIHVGDSIRSDPMVRELDGDEHEHPGLIRSVITVHRDPSTVQQNVVDFFSMMQLRDKVLVALRYFEMLPYKHIGKLLGTSPQSACKTTSDVEERILTFTRNEFLDQPLELHRRINQQWQPPAELAQFIWKRHSIDVQSWIGYFTICLRVDIGYLVDILSPERWTSPLVDAGRGTSLTADQRALIDTMLRAGTSQAETARQVGASIAAVKWQAKRAAAA